MFKLQSCCPFNPYASTSAWMSKVTREIETKFPPKMTKEVVQYIQEHADVWQSFCKQHLIDNYSREQDNPLPDFTPNLKVDELIGYYRNLDEARSLHSSSLYDGYLGYYWFIVDGIFNTYYQIAQFAEEMIVSRRALERTSIFNHDITNLCCSYL